MICFLCGIGNAVVTWIDFFTWRPDGSQVTGRARHKPLRVLPTIDLPLVDNTNSERKIEAFLLITISCRTKYYIK